MEETRLQTRISKRCNKWKRCATGGRGNREGWEARRGGCSKEGRLREHNPRQKMAWCFLEIEGHIILLELNAGHRQETGLKRKATLPSEATAGHAWASDIILRKMRSHGRTFDTESRPVDFFFFFLTKSICSPHERVAAKRQVESVNGKPSAGTQRFHGFSPGILSSASEPSPKPCHHPERECGGDEEASHLLFRMNKFSLVSASKPVRGSGLESPAFNS